MRWNGRDSCQFQVEALRAGALFTIITCLLHPEILRACAKVGTPVSPGPWLAVMGRVGALASEPGREEKELLARFVRMVICVRL